MEKITIGSGFVSAHVDVCGWFALEHPCGEIGVTLSRPMAKELLPHLKRYVDTGKIEEPEKPKCGTCDDKRQVIARLTCRPYSNVIIPCPDCAESGYAKRNARDDRLRQAFFDYAHVTAFEEATTNGVKIRDLKNRMDNVECMAKAAHSRIDKCHG